MEVTAAIEHAESDLAVTLDELRMAKELVTTLENDAKKIQIELVGLRSYAQRRGLTAVPDPGGEVVPIVAGIDINPTGAPDIGLMSRSEAVATVMRTVAAPIDRSTIHEHFIDGGRYDSIDDISLSLSGLKRAGRAEKLGQGLWRLIDATPATGS